MLNEKEIELISYMDYQVLNNGMDGWLGNRGYGKVFDFIEILNKRNSELDQKVASIFKKATLAGYEYYRNKDLTFIPEIKEIFDEAENTIEECDKNYKEVAKDFMCSYGLEDYITKFERGMRGRTTTDPEDETKMWSY